MAALVLVASSSFYVGVHVCRGKVNAIALLDEADGCGHQSLPPCHRKAMDNCCNNERIEHTASVAQPQLGIVQIIPSLLLVAVAAIPDFTQKIIAVHTNAPAITPDHPPNLSGRWLLSLIHILRI